LSELIIHKHNRYIKKKKQKQKIHRMLALHKQCVEHNKNLHGGNGLKSNQQLDCSAGHKNARSVGFISLIAQVR
jgi:hypothetical protein